MAGSYNKATLVGRLGKDPEKRNFQTGGFVVNFSLATSESWKDKATGERKEKTQWHNISIFNEHIANIAVQYCKKGDLVLIEGQIETRKWTDQNGVERYTTEIVLRPFNGLLNILHSHKRAEGGEGQAQSGAQQKSQYSTPANNMEDEIPF